MDKYEQVYLLSRGQENMNMDKLFLYAAEERAQVHTTIWEQNNNKY
jgi:hypothetical protein